MFDRMSRRTYQQYCGIAHALDLVGERWTLLIVRELLTGPKRFKDLQSRLPGISSNLLSKRLQFMEQEGLIEKSMLPPPASTEGYELTQVGRDLEPGLVALGKWGLRTLGRPSPDEEFNPEWLLLSLEGFFRPDRARGLREVHEYRIGETVFHTRIADGSITTTLGSAGDPTFVLETDAETFLGVVVGDEEWDEAFDDGRAHLEGSAESFERLDELYDLSELDASISG